MTTDMFNVLKNYSFVKSCVLCLLQKIFLHLLAYFADQIHELNFGEYMKSGMRLTLSFESMRAVQAMSYVQIELFWVIFLAF